MYKLNIFSILALVCYFLYVDKYTDLEINHLRNYLIKKNTMGELDLGAAAEATVQAYKELASEQSKRFSLSVDQTCIQFLAYVVAEGTGTLVQAAVDTLQLLTYSPECRPSLANTFGVLEALQEMADDARYSEDLRNQAASIFTCLQFSRHIKPNNSLPQSSSSESCKSGIEKSPKETPTKTPSKISSPDSVDNSKSPGLSLITKPEESVSKEKRFLGPYNSKAKTVTLFVDGMVTQKHRQTVENELVRVRGLISIVFDLSKSRVSCRIKKSLTVGKLAAAVSKTSSFQAKQVITNPNGEEVILKIGEEKSVSSTPVEDLPEYLPEEDTPVKDSAGAMAPSSSFKDTASSFISAAANLLQNSFYW